MRKNSVLSLLFYIYKNERDCSCIRNIAASVDSKSELLLFADMLFCDTSVYKIITDKIFTGKSFECFTGSFCRDLKRCFKTAAFGDYRRTENMIAGG